jgi:hypothetical protein
MIVKHADDKTPHIEALEALLKRRNLDATQKRNIERDIRFMRAGMRGEKEAAYEINFYYGEKSENWCVIHDLRIEHEGRVAQIDHLLLNRLMEAFVLETKSFSEGVGCNEHGEFVQFWGGKVQGIASPIEQNAKHIAVLQAALKGGRVPLPRRLGITMHPTFVGLVVVSKTARVSRPKGKHPELDCILKADQLSARLQRDVEKAGLFKLIGADTLHELAKSFAGLHVPAPLPTPARYGLDEEETTSGAPAAAVNTEPGENATQSGSKGGSKLKCEKCEKGVPFAVAKFCWQNKKKFGGAIYCRECQVEVQV